MTEHEHREHRTDPLAPPRADEHAPSGRRIPHPKKKQSRARRLPPRTQRHGLVIVHTGDGKGKTTAALGLLLRAVGAGMTVGMFQFIKNSAADYGEHRAARQLGVEIIPLGDGFTWLTENIEADRALAAKGWTRCRDAILAGTYDMLILDELTYLLSFGWLEVQEVVHAIATRPRGTHIVITGRDAHDALVAAADLVTEMRSVKHPHRDQGIGAQPGIEM
jgi:cob(I)alamin adenosyltransferase